jgi:flavodoxin
MNCLVVFYSRSGTTRKAAQELARIIGCGYEEIVPKRKYKGPFGFILGGYEATRKKLPAISEPQSDLSGIDTVILGTPVWANTMASPVRTLLSRHGERCRRVAFFLTKGGSTNTKTFGEMERLCGQAPLATLELRTSEVRKENSFKTAAAEKMRDFAGKLSSK